MPIATGRTVCGTSDSFHGRRRLGRRVETLSDLRTLETFGPQFHELEQMGATMALGILAIKNNSTAFLHLLQMHEDTAHALNKQDLYGNTPLHYWALRETAFDILQHLQELGGNCAACNFAGESVACVVATRKVTCKEPNLNVGARFCATNMTIEIVSVCWKC